MKKKMDFLSQYDKMIDEIERNEFYSKLLCH